MTIELTETDRIYKIIEARTGVPGLNKKFISKIDKDNKITIYTYTFDKDDVRKDGTIKNKMNGMLIGPIPVEKFNTVIDVNNKIYPKFEIVEELDYSSFPLMEAIEKMKSETDKYNVRTEEMKKK